MPVLFVHDDWWMDLMLAQLFAVDTPDPETQKPGTLGMRYRARLYHQSVPVALVNHDGGPIEETLIIWLKPHSESEFLQAAQRWHRSFDQHEISARVAAGEFLRMLAARSAELGRWPGFAVGTSFHDPMPSPLVSTDAEPGVVELDGREHQLTGWVDGKLYYHAPDGGERCVSDHPLLVEQLVRTCVAYFTSAAEDTPTGSS